MDHYLSLFDGISDLLTQGTCKLILGFWYLSFWLMVAEKIFYLSVVFFFEALRAPDNISFYGGRLMKAHEVICYVSLGPQEMDLCH